MSELMNFWIFINKTIKVAKFIGKFKVHCSIGTMDENKTIKVAKFIG